MKTIKIEKTPTTFFLPAQDFLAVHNAVSKEEARYYLNGVFVEQSDIVRMVATDGCVLLRKECDDSAFVGEDGATQSTDYERGFLLKLDHADKAMKAKTRRPAWIYGDITTGIVQVVDFDGDMGSEQKRVGVVEFEQIDGTFPVWRRVMPKPSDTFAPVNVDLDKLMQIRAAAKVFGKDASVSIHAAALGDPMLVKFSYMPSLVGVVMPAYVSG